MIEKWNMLGSFKEKYPNKEIVILRKRFYQKCGLMFHCSQIQKLVALFETANTEDNKVDKWYYLNKLAIAHKGYERKFVLARDQRLFLNLKRQFANTLVKGIDNGKYKKEYDALHCPIAWVWYINRHWLEDISCD